MLREEDPIAYLLRLKLRTITAIHISSGAEDIEIETENLEELIGLLRDLIEGADIKAKQVRKFIRDARSQAYIPGSSLKGSILSLILYAYEKREGKQRYYFPAFKIYKERSKRKRDVYKIRTHAPRLFVPDLYPEGELEVVEAIRIGARRRLSIRLEVLSFEDRVEVPIIIDVKRFKSRISDKGKLEEDIGAKAVGLRITREAYEILSNNGVNDLERFDEILKLGSRQAILRYATSFAKRISFDNVLSRDILFLGFGTSCVTKTIPKSCLERWFGEKYVNRHPLYNFAKDLSCGKYGRPKTLWVYTEGRTQMPLGLVEFEASKPQKINSIEELLHGAGKGL